MDKQPMMDFDESWLSAYLDHELTEEQSQYVEELLPSRPDLQQTLEGLVRVRAAIAQCKLDVPADTRIVRHGPWDAPKPAASPSQQSQTLPKTGWSMQSPTWLFSLAAMILVLATLSSLYWVSSRNRNDGMLATSMEPQGKIAMPKSQESVRSEAEEVRLQELEAKPEIAAAGNSPMVASDFVTPPSAMSPPSPVPALRSDPAEAASNLAFRSGQEPIQPKTPTDDFFAYFIQADAANKYAIDPLRRNQSELTRSDEKDTDSSLKQNASGDYLWSVDADSQEFGRSTVSDTGTAIVWFRSMTQAARSDTSSDKQVAGGSRGELADTPSAGPLPRLRKSAPPTTILEIRIPVESWSPATAALREKGFEIPEDFTPGDYRFEAIENEGDLEKPWTVRKLEALPPAEKERTPAYFSLIVIPAKPSTKSGSSE